MSRTLRPYICVRAAPQGTTPPFLHSLSVWCPIILGLPFHECQHITSSLVNPTDNLGKQSGDTLSVHTVYGSDRTAILEASAYTTTHIGYIYFVLTLVYRIQKWYPVFTPCNCQEWCFLPVGFSPLNSLKNTLKCHSVQVRPTFGSGHLDSPSPGDPLDCRGPLG